jgi:hypothetical protein
MSAEHVLAEDAAVSVEAHASRIQDQTTNTVPLAICRAVASAERSSPGSCSQPKSLTYEVTPPVVGFPGRGKHGRH